MRSTESRFSPCLEEEEEEVYRYLLTRALVDFLLNITARCIHHMFQVEGRGIMACGTKSQRQELTLGLFFGELASSASRVTQIHLISHHSHRSKGTVMTTEQTIVLEGVFGTYV